MEPRKVQIIETAVSGAVPIGVVIPTYNRVSDLIKCLRHLELQTWRAFEVVVVDDGSTDATRASIEEYQSTAPFPLQYLYQENAGPAKARNKAIAALHSPVCVIIGDDIFPSPDFLERHLKFHRQHVEIEAVAVGYTVWAEEGQTVTRFMRWLGRDGIQFAYGELLSGTPASWKHFYTSNLSVKTEYLLRNPFHEGFRKAAMEDTELGYRLAKEHGLKMGFLADAIAEHLHPTDYLRSCQRMVDVGASAYQMAELWPEFRWPQTKVKAKRILLNILVNILAEPRFILPLLVRVTTVLNRVWMPNPLTPRVLSLHARYGYKREARRRTLHADTVGD